MIFTRDAIIDDVVAGGIRSGVDERIVYLQRALKHVRVSQHSIAIILLDLEGKTARAKVQCVCPMVVEMLDGETKTMVLGVRYRDRLVCKNDGWRISELVEENSWHLKMPADFAF